jgi:hypothetical protein
MHLNPIERSDHSLLNLPATLGFELEDGIGILRLTRAEKRNALDNATILGLHRFFANPPDGVKDPGIIGHRRGRPFHDVA